MAAIQNARRQQHEMEEAQQHKPKRYAVPPKQEW